MRLDNFNALCLIWCVIVYMYGADSMAKDALKTYKKRRDLKASPEPAGDDKKVKKDEKIFVIQRHDATREHYDFRLNIDGVLVSWAIPKGPSTDPNKKRLAVRTDDHPLDYAYFEGVIPEGHYGAGTVMVWDIGTYKNITKEKDKLVPLKKALKDGKIEVFLEGKKLHGGYVLIKFKEEKDQWLFKKIDDEYADARRNPVSTETKSVLTGRTLKEITQEES